MAQQFGQDSEAYRRYAIYFTPPPGALAEFGAAWLGWDLVRGCGVPHPTLRGLPRPVEMLTETPRKYGFHATLKPPFRISDHATPDGLMASLEQLSKELSPVFLDGLKVSSLGHFVALTPVGDTENLNALAASIVRGLDHFRRPPAEAELEKRRANGLSERQDVLLKKWGYPFVMEEFRFHMTLSGRLAEHEAQALCRVLGMEFGTRIPGRFAIDAVTLCGEDAQGQFHEIHRYPLTGQSAEM